MEHIPLIKKVEIYSKFRICKSNLMVVEYFCVLMLRRNL